MRPKLQSGDLVHIDPSILQMHGEQRLVKITKVNGSDAHVQVNAYGDTKKVPLSECTFVGHGLPINNKQVVKYT